MALALVRVDDRLIHGQIVAVWLKALGAHRILVVDDKTAKDEFLREVLELTAPPGVPVEVMTVDEGLTRVREAAESPARVFVLLRSPIAALRLREGGVPFEVLNVGGLGAGPGRRQLYRNISAGEQELEAMRELERRGTRVEFRIVPDDRPVTLGSVKV
jgi:mannose/fructose/N-acetylgalactosamine-specific phosphotransferase system component IIB